MIIETSSNHGILNVVFRKTNADSCVNLKVVHRKDIYPMLKRV